MSTILTPPSGAFFRSGDRFENNLGRTLTITDVSGPGSDATIFYTYDSGEFYPDPQPGARRAASTIGWRKL